MNGEHSDFPEKFIADHATGGFLSTLKPLDCEEVKIILNHHKGISLKYINFIAKVGVGETRNGLYIYQPYIADELTNHPSFQIYNSSTSRRLFGLPPAKPNIPKRLVCIADSGASWRYCLDLNKGDKVVCLDMLDANVTNESDDFFEFIEQQVFDI